jgi:hypothetical protein
VGENVPNLGAQVVVLERRHHRIALVLQRDLLARLGSPDPTP